MRGEYPQNQSHIHILVFLYEFSEYFQSQKVIRMERKKHSKV